MKVLILGMGHAGKAIARRLRAQGHQVVGTTTTPAKVAELESLADQVAVLRGSETDKVIAAAEGCDLIVATVAPNVKNTRTREEREAQYHEVLENTLASAAKACQRVIFLSSFSVYGNGGAGEAPITEQTPTANHEEPSSRYYQAAERHALSVAGGCVLRLPDIHGAPGDMSFTDRVKMAHDYFGGKTVFGADAPLYTIHFEDVVDAVIHAIEQELRGIYNVCDNDTLPPSNKLVFDAICDAQGWPRLEFLDQIQAPNRRISADKLYATGYRVKHGDPNAELLAQAS